MHLLVRIGRIRLRFPDNLVQERYSEVTKHYKYAHGRNSLTFECNIWFVIIHWNKKLTLRHGSGGEDGTRCNLNRHREAHVPLPTPSSSGMVFVFPIQQFSTLKLGLRTTSTPEGRPVYHAQPR
jgi:hypothetical protein